MLKHLDASSLSQKVHIFSDFESENDLWIVADLHSKTELQNRGIKKFGALSGDSILRISEFWKDLLWRNHPDWRVISKDLAHCLVADEIQRMNIPWVKNERAANTVLKIMPQLLPLLNEEEYKDLLRDWLKENPNSLLKWGHWFELASHVWQFFHQKKMIPPDWIPSLLLIYRPTLLPDKNRIFVDLGFSLTHCELKLFMDIAQDKNVVILKPDMKLDPVGNESLSNQEIGLKEWLHFSTPLAEVKNAVAQVREWLEAGVPIEEIAIIAPQIEDYWTVLAPHLDQEGIAASKPRTTNLHGLPDIQRWLAKIRQDLKIAESSDLEMTTFSAEADANYNQFKKQFTRIYQSSGLRNSNQEAQMKRDQWVEKICKLWDGESISVLERVIQHLLKESSNSLFMSAFHWMRWLETALCKLEIELSPAKRDQLKILNLIDVDWVDVSSCIVMGVTEEQLHDQFALGISDFEIQKIKSDLGFELISSVNQVQEKELERFLKRPFKTVVISNSKIDFSHQPQTPSKVWLLGCRDPKKSLSLMVTPKVTRWDEIQKGSLDVISLLRQKPMGQIEEFLTQVKCDQGDIEIKPFGSGLVKKISASSVERFSSCGFVFAAEKLFKLQDLPENDLDLDPMTRGSLTHFLFEKLTTEPFQELRTEDDIRQIITDFRIQNEIHDFGMWKHLEPMYVNLGLRFIQFEKEWRTQFPKTQTVSVELPFKGYWDSKLSKFISLQEGGFEGDLLQVSGRIDRVDSDGQKYSVIDYKSSVAQLSSAQSWVEHECFQLAFYIEAIECGLTSLNPGPVQGAFFYSSQDFERDRGLQLKEESALFPESGRRTSMVSQEEKKKILEGLRLRLSELTQKMSTGEFFPKPKDLNLCDDCQWRSVCRAPHLNL